jgi:hypothetical protein
MDAVGDVVRMPPWATAVYVIGSVLVVLLVAVCAALHL